MNKTQELLAKIAAGTHRIDQYGFVNRWVPSRGEWMTCTNFRKDVVMRAQVELMYGPNWRMNIQQANTAA